MSSDPNPQASTRRWRPLTREQRRVAGVLVEKAKTTPEAYPMTVNAITTGANQKSNRSPLMNLSPDDVQTALDRLREMGAVVEVHGDGRAIKYRHLLYEWMGVDKVEMAVMTELLLRGQQTLGELRQRASRMEPIDSLEQLRDLIAGLVRKGLMIELTPPGRGQIVTHSLYGPEELAKVRALVAAGPQPEGEGDSGEESPPATPPHVPGLAARVEKLEELVAALTARLDRLES